jgi:glycosyltransferase involved in cell wall biosynthesis
MMQANRIKLLMMITNFQIGGTERQVANLALGIDSSRFDLHLACLRHSGELLGELETLPVPRPEFRIGSLYSPKTLWQAMRLARYVRKNRIQVVHSFGLYPNLFTVPAAKLAGASIVVASIRDTGDGLTPVQKWVQKMVCRLADCVLVNAGAIRQSLIEQGYNPAKIVVIQNGITLSKFASRRRGAILRQELGLSLTAQLVVVFSRLNPMKGVRYFIEAAISLTKKFPDARFLIVGDGGNRKELEEQACRVGLGQRVVFTGFRTDIPELLREAAVSVLPSLSEGLSNTLLESMAAGVPAVATSVGGNPEVIEHGVSGLLVPPRDAAALAAAMGSLLDDGDFASRLGQAGRQRVAELFSVERSVRDTEHLYRRLAGANGRI